MVLAEGRGREFLFTLFLLGVAGFGQWKVIPEGAHVCRPPNPQKYQKLLRK